MAEAAAATANGALSTYQWRCGVRINNPRDYHRASSSRAPWCIHGVPVRLSVHRFVRMSVASRIETVSTRLGVTGETVAFDHAENYNTELLPR